MEAYYWICHDIMMGCRSWNELEDGRYEIWRREAKSAFTEWRYNNEKDNIR
jgi:hypothetical protein